MSDKAKVGVGYTYWIIDTGKIQNGVRQYQGFYDFDDAVKEARKVGTGEIIQSICTLLSSGSVSMKNVASIPVPSE